MKRSKRRKIITNKNLEVKMFGDEIIEGFSFLRLNTNEKIRSINYPPGYFIRFPSTWNLETKEQIFWRKKKK